MRSTARGKGIGKKNCDDLKFFRFNSGKEVEYIGGDLASIGSRSRHKEAAWSFIQSITKPSSLDAIAKLNKKLPAYKDAANSPQAQSNPLSKFVAEGLPTGQLRRRFGQLAGDACQLRLPAHPGGPRSEGSRQGAGQPGRTVPMSATLERPAPTVAERRTAPAKDSRKLIRGQVRAGWLFLSPALLHSAIFIVIPVVAAVVLSFTDYSFGDSWSWVGFGNYVDLFKDQDFRAALVNTILYAVVVIPLSMAISLAVATGLNQKIKAIGFFRTAFYIPTVTATVAVATIWLWIYNPSSGLANGFLSLFGFAPGRWLSDPNTALPSLMLVGIWQGLGTKVIIYLAALQGVSRDLLESAFAGRRESVAAVRQRHLARARAGAVLRPGHLDRRHLPGLRPGLRDDEGRPRYRDDGAGAGHLSERVPGPATRFRVRRDGDHDAVDRDLHRAGTPAPEGGCQ